MIQPPRWNLFILLDSDPGLLHEILKTKPDFLRVLSYHAFDLFWKAFKSREKVLQQRSQEMQTILDGIQDLILVITPDQEIVDANDAFLRQMGYNKEDVVGKNASKFTTRPTSPAIGDKSGCPLNTVIRNREGRPDDSHPHRPFR